MNVVDLILSLIEVRAAHLSGCAFMYMQTYDEENYTDTPSAAAREDLYDAQASALRDLAAEIRAGMITDVQRGRLPSGEKYDVRYVFIQEMAGTMTASVHSSSAELDAREARFQREHEAYYESNGNGVCHGRVVNLTPSKSDASPRASAALDVRWAMITDVDREFDVSIHDTEEELQVAIEAFKEEYEYWIKSQDAVYACHEILIPPKPQLDDDGAARR